MWGSSSKLSVPCPQFPPRITEISVSFRVMVPVGSSSAAMLSPAVSTRTTAAMLLVNRFAYVVFMYSVSVILLMIVLGIMRACYFESERFLCV